MEKIGFGNKWIEWTKECFSSVSYNIIVNGKKSGTIFPSRGLKQGDPLSPYLFLLVMDVLSRMLNKAIEVKSLEGIKLGKESPVLSHLFVANDSLFFLPAKEKSAAMLKNILEKFCVGSGQSINLSKSSVVFSANVPELVRKERADQL